MLCFVLSCTGVYSGWGASLAVNLETFSIGQVTPYRRFLLSRVSFACGGLRSNVERRLNEVKHRRGTCKE